jgi:hypothetical protein
MREVSRWHTASVATAVVALLGLAASLAFGAKLTTKSATATLPADNATHTVTAKCAKGAKATGGGVQLSDDLDDYVEGSYPAGKRQWTAAGARPDFLTGDSQLTALARCLKGAKLKTESASITLPDDNDSHSVTAKCPRGTKVSGGGVQLSNDDFNIAEPNGSYPSSKREWTAVGEAYDPGIELIATARCLKKAKLIRRSESFDMPDDNATHTVTAKCPKGTKTTGGGIELSEPYNDYVQGSYPTGKREWTAAGYDAGVVTAHVVCLKKPKK